MLYFPQLEWAELAPHKMTGKIFGWFRRPGPQRLTCDGRPCPDLGSEVCRQRCPPDTGQLCAVHKAWEPLGLTRPSPPAHFQGPSCQTTRSLVLQRDPRGHAQEALREAPVDWPAQPPRRCLQGIRVTVWPPQESTHRLPSCQTQVLSGLPAFAPASPPAIPSLLHRAWSYPSQPRLRSSSAHPSVILHMQGHTLP